MTTATATSSTPQNTDAAIPTRRVKRHPRVSGVELWLAAAAARASAEARVGYRKFGSIQTMT
jgi:hypothetical protein